MNVAIIPARGGSKRIPGKNVKLFSGRPIISYGIKAAIESGVFDRVIVSTDSEQIAETARKEGAEVPFMRPAAISDDYTTLIDVLQHALIWLKENGIPAEYACLILATAPFIRSKDILKGYDMLINRQVTSVFTVTTFSFPILRALTIKQDGYVDMMWPEHELTRSNDLPEAYHDAGQFYWINVEKFLKVKKVYTGGSLPLILPRYMVQDIDKPEDWERAELMYQAYIKTRTKD